jgi:hypothetical protein
VSYLRLSISDELGGALCGTIPSRVKEKNLRKSTPMCVMNALHDPTKDFDLSAISIAFSP